MKIKLYKKLKRKYKLRQYDDLYLFTYKGDSYSFSKLSDLFLKLYECNIIDYLILKKWDNKKCSNLNKRVFKILNKRNEELDKLLKTSKI